MQNFLKNMKKNKEKDEPNNGKFQHFFTRERSSLRKCKKTKR